MGLFKRKPRVSLDAFCRDFYDHQLLDAQMVGIDAASIFFETVRQSVIEADASFASVDPQLFASEMTILRFEVFGIAWLHEVGDKHAAAQSEFTKQYLEEHGESRIWDAIEPYNQAVARSSTFGKKPDTPSGRAYLVFVDSMRMQLFEKWHKQGFDAKCVARAANRLSTDEAWKRRLTPSFLMLTLCDRLGCDLNEEGQFRLTATIVGFYNGAREAINNVKIEI